jgi:hypothetical protein
MTDISKNILQKIKKEKIQPYSKKHFLLKKSIVWTLFGLSILLGIVASSVTIFQLKHTDWDLYDRSNYSLLEFLAIVIPYFWLIFLMIFIGIAYNYFRRTEKGYRYHTLLIIAISIIVSIIGGIGVYQTGFSERIEAVFQENIPVYRMINRGRHRMWMSPEQGLLAGEIKEIISAEEIELIDLHGNNWVIDISRAFWRGRLRPEVGLEIKLIGKIKFKGQFVATEIRPLQGRRMQGRGRRLRSSRRNGTL